MFHLRFGSYEAKHQRKQRLPQQYEDETYQQTEKQGADEHFGYLTVIISSESGGCKPRGAHAQESEQPEDHIEHRSSHGYGREKELRTEMTGNGCITKAEQRHRDIAHDSRYAQPQYLF